MSKLSINYVPSGALDASPALVIRSKACKYSAMVATASREDECAEMLMASARGDEHAFRKLYERTSPQLFAVLLRILQTRSLAEDALQEVFVSVWRNAGSYAPDRGTGLSWLIAVSRYKAIDIRRKRRFETVAASIEDTANIPDDGSNDPGAVELPSQHRRLENCMRELSPQQLQAIRLAYLQGLTHQEIAVRISSPLGTVKSWLRRALGALRECLER